MFLKTKSLNGTKIFFKDYEFTKKDMTVINFYMSNSPKNTL